MRGKGVSSFQEFFAKFSVIINLSIEDDGNRSILVVDLLAPAVHIYNRKPPHAEPGLIIKKESVVVRPSTADKRTHPTY
jgi:hypothetical protein